MGPDFEKIMVSRVEIYPLQRVTASHAAIYSKDCKGKFHCMKIPRQIYPLKGNFLWYPGCQDPRNLEPCWRSLCPHPKIGSKLAPCKVCVSMRVQ